MNVDVREIDGAKIVECNEPIARVDQAADLVSACIEAGSRRLLLDAGNLAADFFDLRTRFAGELLQKLQNYGVRVAGVFPGDRRYNERFGEFLIEARRGRGFRAFSTRPEAEAWLASP